MEQQPRTTLLPLDRLGAHQRGRTLRFGLLLPGLTHAAGYRVQVSLLHERDQFRQDVPAVAARLRHAPDPELGDYWSVTVHLDRPVPQPGPAWGESGRYVYSYRVRTPHGDEIGAVSDPFARDFGTGLLSAVVVDEEPFAWSEAEAWWRVPPPDRLVMYELHAHEFAGDLSRVADRLDYLADLGVTCLQLMPLSNVQRHVDWGYIPQNYFGVDERFGGRRDLRRLVDQAHQRGIAVVLDAVYGHTSLLFPYAHLYGRLPDVPNPFVGDFGDNLFADGAASPDYDLELTRNYFYTLNQYCLEEFHVDGFRYDCVPNYWDGPTGNGYANLCYRTYQLVKRTRGAGYHRRFFGAAAGDDDRIGLIQVAERLGDPVGVLRETYSTSAWQDGTLCAAADLARGAPDALATFGQRLGLHHLDYRSPETTGEDTIDKLPLQYLENHDHSRLLAEIRRKDDVDIAGNPLFAEGDRSAAYKLQPYLIGLLTARGLPMLWQGQEFGESYVLPRDGLGRVAVSRPVRWEYFSDPHGRPLVRLVRRLLALRRRLDQLRADHHVVHDDEEHRAKHVLVIERRSGPDFSLVVLNFSDSEQVLLLRSPVGGAFREELDGAAHLRGLVADQPTKVTVPSNYGRIWTATDTRH
ncbi:MAG TPA: alpha-amylase family glycosyl hydrolase [Pilimelia sp.]|nr:alpha-amylase family glycosyl hydrolase [Pilimelia sp.]